MKNTTVLFSTMTCLVMLALNSNVVLAEPLKRLEPFSTQTPNVQNEIRRSTVISLEGTYKLWSRVTGLGVRTGIDFRDPSMLKRLVEELHVSGDGMPWNGYSGSDDIRIYFGDPRNSDLIWYFYRNHKAYCVPSLYHGKIPLCQPGRMYLVSPASSRQFEALIHSISGQAKRHHASFKLRDMGGD